MCNDAYIVTDLYKYKDYNKTLKLAMPFAKSTRVTNKHPKLVLGLPYDTPTVVSTVWATRVNYYVKNITLLLFSWSIREASSTAVSTDS